MRISDWSSDVCSSDLRTLTASPATTATDPPSRRTTATAFKMHAGSPNGAIMIRNTLLALACAVGLLATAQVAHAADAPQRAPAGPGPAQFKSSTLSSEPSENTEGGALGNEWVS